MTANSNIFNTFNGIVNDVNVDIACGKRNATGWQVAGGCGMGRQRLVSKQVELTIDDARLKSYRCCSAHYSHHITFHDDQFQETLINFLLFDR